MSETTTKWITKELHDKDELVFNNCIRAVKIWLVFHTDTGGFTDNEISFHVLNDGNIIIKDENEMVNLHPPQIELLKKILAEM